MSSERIPAQPGLLPRKTPQTKRQFLQLLGAQHKNARTSFEAHWRELGEFFRPRRTRFTTSDRNRGDKRSQKIIDSTAVYAARTLASGMMSGITSPARAWFKMALSDTALMELDTVKQWAEEVRERMAAVMLRSNFYSTLPTFYSDLGVFGTTCQLVEEDDVDVIRCTHFAIGEYWLGLNSKQQVRSFMREFQMSTRQIVERFGQRIGDSYSVENLSIAVQNAWTTGALETMHDVAFHIYENHEHDPSKLHSKYKQFGACYYEMGGENTKLLEESGFDECPVMAIRWEVTTGDVYATDCPGMTALADNKELQFSRKMGAQAIEKAVKPPMIAPATMKNAALTQIPGGVSYVDETSDKKFRPAIDTSGFRLDWLAAWIADLKQSIDKAFFVDMFLLISNIEKSNTTATEILEKKEEKLLTLGPVLTQVDVGFLDPFFARLFGIMTRKGLLPDPPPELHGKVFHVEYESIMAQAQRAQGRSGVEALAVFALNLAKIDQASLDKIDTDEMIDTYSTMAGTPPAIIRSDEKVQSMRKARADAAQQQQAAQQAEQMAGAAHKLAGADTGGKNALTDLLSSAQAGNGLGADSPQGGL
jgi:hypothetical protein